VPERLQRELIMDEEIRKTAVRRYILQGESPKTIYSSLNRSRQWFYKWLKRYQIRGKEWYKDCHKERDNILRNMEV
jgi:transposase